MAGLGGVPKLSSQQQESLLEDLAPAFVTGSRMYDRAASALGNDDDSELNGLVARLSACLADILVLMREVEDGRSQGSLLDPSEAADTAKILVSEVAALTGRIRMTLSRSRGRSRVV